MISRQIFLAPDTNFYGTRLILLWHPDFIFLAFSQVIDVAFLGTSSFVWHDL